MEDSPSKELLFCSTFCHDEEDQVQLDLIQFPYPVNINELRVVPRGQWAHQKLEEDMHYGQTQPSSLKVEFFFKSCKTDSSAIYQKMGNLDFSEKGSFQFFPKTLVLTEFVVVRGRYKRLTLCVYGRTPSPAGEASSPSPPPPPPPPPPAKDKPSEVKQGVEEISTIKTIESVSSTRTSDWNWEDPEERLPEDPHFAEFPEHEAEAIPQKVAEPSHAPVRRGPRTPSPPPPPSSSEQWPGQEPGERWSDEEEVSPEEWHTQDLWVEGQPGDLPQDEPAGTWDDNEGTWQTTDSWEPQDGGDWEEGERGPRDEDWKKDQTEGKRKGKGPRTPPGEPRSPQSYDRKRSRPRDRQEESGESREERKRKRRKPVEMFEQLSPERSLIGFPSDGGRPPDDQEDEEVITEAYEEISDEEVLEEVEGFMENMDIDSLDAGWGDVTPFDPYQAEMEPLKCLAAPGKTWYDREKATLEKFPAESEEGHKLRILIATFQAGDRGPKWVSCLEEIPNLVKPYLTSLLEEELNTVCTWTIEALDYSIAQTQPIAVNIRQLKAGMKLTSCLCSCGETVVEKLVERDIFAKLFSLLFEAHMASSLKLMILKALDSSTNWQIGLEKFLTEAEGQQKNGYQKLLKFLLTEQTVRVVQAGTALVQKFHLYEILGTLKDTVDMVLSTTPIKQLKDTEQSVPPQGEGSRPPSSLDENSPDVPDSQGQPLEPDFANLDEGLFKKLESCLKEIYDVFKTGAYNLVQPTPKSFPTTAAPSREEGDDIWSVLYHIFAKRDLLGSLTFLVCCPSTACVVSLMTTVYKIFTSIADSFQGILMLASQPEIVKTLFQAFTTSDEEEPEDTSLQQLGLEIMHKMAALQILDSLMDKMSSGQGMEHRENVQILECLEQAFALTFNPVGRRALADVFSKEDNFKYFFALLKADVPENESEDPQPKKNALDGYLHHLIWVVLQYNEDMNLLKRYSEVLNEQTADKDFHKWVAPLKSGLFDRSAVGPLVDYIQGTCDDLVADFSNISPGILTSLRVLKHLTCVPVTMQSEGQQKDLSYQLATLEMFSHGGINALSTCIKKISDLLLRPWQMGHCLTSKQQHLAETIAMLALKLLKVVLNELFSTGTVQFRDERPVSSIVSLYTVVCCAPPSGTLGQKPQEIHKDIIDILLTFTTAPAVAPDSTEALSHGCWNTMLKVILQYIPTGPYTYLGGLSLLSDLLPLPLPLQTQENLSEEETSQGLHLRKLWSIHVLCQSIPIQTIISQLAYTSSPVLQLMLRRVLCQISDLAAPTALLVIRSVLEAFTSKLKQTDGVMEPSSLELAQVLSLFVYLISQPSIKAAFLHLIGGSLGAEDPLHDILKKMLILMNIPFESSAHLQAQECIVASLQSSCSPDITLLSDENLSMLEQLSNSLPGKEDMNLICTHLLDHVTSPDHSYASILPALRMIATLLDHDYGFNHVKSALLTQQGILSEFYKRLTDAFTRDSSDYLSTLSTAVDLLHFLVSADSYQEEDQGSSEAARYRTQALTTKELRQLIGWEVEGEDHSLKQLEKILVECCKEDEKLESLLDSLSSLLQVLDGADPSDKPPVTAQEVELPPAMKLADQFSSRLVFYVSEDEDDRFVPGIWTGLPPMDELDAEPEMIKCNLEEMRAKFIPDFNLQEELEKGLMTEERSPGKPKPKHGRRYQALISKGRGQFFNTVRRAHNTGFRGGKRNHDVFRQRAQNTSRPPSMHVDDFMNFENSPSSGEHQFNRNQPQRRGMGAPRGPRGPRGGFRQWSGSHAQFRRDTGPPRGMSPRGRGQWGPGRKPMRSGYHQGPPVRNYIPRRPDPRSEGRLPPRSPMGPQPYNRPSSAERPRGPYRGMRAMGPRGSPSPRRGGRGYRGGHWTGDPHMRPPGKGMRGRPPPGRHSRSFTR
ncbi:Protein virilizer-like [Holothuria leucospilota]|uniref:Protein virilizer-like n=1 Tax=Holothuria leucospilota TaxID=206669 RepID=A0A9Q1CAS5_HOLLE|nr:Protein virilizer-like [Holothuria leucospilota]